ncbi:MAG: acetate--CoA ligase family protein [Desulfonatronovibrio sp.]
MLEKLLNPESIAVAASSRTSIRDAVQVVANLKKCGFQGAIYPVNFKSDKIPKQSCYPDLDSCPGAVDLCIITAPASKVIALTKQAAYSGAGSIIVLSPGFKESGSQGRKLEKELRDICLSRSIPLLGPDCNGLINTQHRMNASLSSVCPAPGGISVISEFRAMHATVPEWALSRGIGLGKIISLGNRADLNEGDFLKVLAKDDDTKVIVCCLENFGGEDEFLRLAEQTAEIKPIIMLKPGITRAGARVSSMPDTGPAASDTAYGAALKRAGIIRARQIDNLLDYAQAFAAQPLPDGGNICVVTNSGGMGVMAVDALESTGLNPAILSRSTKARLRSILPKAGIVDNPVDVLGDTGPSLFIRVCDIVLDDPGVQGVILLIAPQKKIRPLSLAGKLAGINHPSKPVLTSFMGGGSMNRARKKLTESQIPDYPTPERAVDAMGALCDYAAWKRRPPRVVTNFPVNHRRVQRVIRWHERMNISRISEIEAKEILQAYGFRIPEGKLIHTREQAVEQALRIGYPVVMKIISPDVINRTDVGGIRLNLISAEQVRDAFDLMMVRINRQIPGADIRGVYIERMGAAGREIILGMSRDPLYGPVLMFGLGGILVEAMKDVAFHLAPVTADEAMQMLKSTRSYNQLKDSRGNVSVDLDSIVQSLQRISQLAMEYPGITELAISPFIVGEYGVEPYVADANMSLKKSGNTNG